MKIHLKLKVLFLLFFLISPCFVKSGVAQQKFEKSVFYNVMATGDKDAVDNELTVLQNAGPNNKGGYEGALLMKKAGMVGRPKKKLDLFKEGRIKMETAILADKENVEFHFLRLAIEEHAPKIVKYKADIENDKAIILKNFKNLHPVVQHAILDYCKNSKVLNADDLSGH